MNRVILSGHLARDPELRHTQSGLAQASFTLAVDKQLSRDKKAELQQQGKPTADFPRIITWGKVAEIASNNLSKGRKVLIDGVLTTGSYKDQNGTTHYTTDVIAQKIEFMDSRQEQRQEAPSEYGADFTNGMLDDDEVPFTFGWAGGLEEA